MKDVNEMTAFFDERKKNLESCSKIIAEIEKTKKQLDSVNGFIEWKNKNEDKNKFGSKLAFKHLFWGITAEIKGYILGEWATDDDVLAIHNAVKPILERHLKELKRRLVDTGVEMAQQMKQEFCEQQVSA